MSKSLTKILVHKHVLYYVLAFFFVRLLSFAISGQNIVQAIVVFVLLMAFGSIYYKSQETAFLILLGELLLGGGGHMLEFFGLSLRTVLFLTFAILWFFHHLTFLKSLRRLYISHHTYHLLAALAVVTIVSSVIGLVRGNPFAAVVADLLPYMYFILILPLYHLQHNTSHQVAAMRIMCAFLIGSALNSIINFVIFSGGYAYIQSPYYKWLRDVNHAKITDMGEGFFRIVFPEHLLVLPVLLVLMALAMHRKMTKAIYLLIALAAVILVLDLSRTFFLGLAVGSLFLLYKHKFTAWISVVGTTALMFFAMFFCASLLASGGTTLGLDIFTQRAQSFIDPTVETSTFTRIMLIEPIFELVRQSPLIGVGLGSSITGTNPQTFEQFTTRHMDWGYFEMLAEIGLAGTFIYISIIILILRGLMYRIITHKHLSGFYVGMLAALVSLLVANITSPAIFHVYGVMFVVTALSMLLRPYHLLDFLYPNHDHHA